MGRPHKVIIRRDVRGHLFGIIITMPGGNPHTCLGVRENGTHMELYPLQTIRDSLHPEASSPEFARRSTLLFIKKAETYGEVIWNAPKTGYRELRQRRQNTSDEAIWGINDVPF